jgi:predicted TPR repeat methyltransferase
MNIFRALKGFYLLIQGSYPQGFTTLTAMRFDSLSAKYETSMTGKFFEPTLVASVVTNSDQAKLDVLDVGCGTGLLGDALSNFRNIFLYGIDVSELMLEVARTKAKYSQLEQRVFIDFRSSMDFDFILASSMFQFVPEPKTFFRHAKKLLKKGGVSCVFI